MDDPVAILRMIERILAVLIGGLAIYLGYRLFFHLPFERSHEGQLELPGVKIVLSRVGPGVFCAAFGTVVLFYSLTTKIHIDKNKMIFAGAPMQKDGVENTTPDILDSESFTGVSGAETPGVGVTPQQRSKALTTIEMLNCAQRLLAGEDTSPDLQDQFSIAIRDAKRTLMLSVWNEDDWGPADKFDLTGPADDTPFQLRSMFTATYKDCSK